jgi:hypothetical protein
MKEPEEKKRITRSVFQATSSRVCDARNKVRKGRNPEIDLHAMALTWHDLLSSPLLQELSEKGSTARCEHFVPVHVKK